jgi:hypothetical protein
MHQHNVATGCIGLQIVSIGSGGLLRALKQICPSDSGGCSQYQAAVRNDRAAASFASASTAGCAARADGTVPVPWCLPAMRGGSIGLVAAPICR